MTNYEGSVRLLDDTLLQEYGDVEVRQCRSLKEVYQALSMADLADVALVSQESVSPEKSLFERVSGRLARGETVDLALFFAKSS